HIQQHTSTSGISSPLNKSNLKNSSMTGSRCAIDRSAAQGYPQLLGSCRGGIVGGEYEKTVNCSHEGASRGRGWNRWRNDRCACFHHTAEQFVARIEARWPGDNVRVREREASHATTEHPA